MASYRANVTFTMVSILRFQGVLCVPGDWLCALRHTCAYLPSALDMPNEATTTSFHIPIQYGV